MFCVLIYTLICLPVAARACVLPQSPSPAARSRALSSSFRCKRALQTDSKARNATEQNGPDGKLKISLTSSF